MMLYRVLRWTMSLYFRARFGVIRCRGVTGERPGQRVVHPRSAAIKAALGFARYSSGTF